MAEQFKHDSTIPKVKITRQDLIDGLNMMNSKSKEGDKMSGTSSKMVNRNKNERFGAQPYKHGEGLIRKNENTPQSERKMKNKRPDMPLYKPKRGGLRTGSGFDGGNMVDEKNSELEIGIDEMKIDENVEKKEKSVSNKCREALIQEAEVSMDVCDEKLGKRGRGVENECWDFKKSSSQNSVCENGARRFGSNCRRGGRANRTRSMTTRSEEEQRWGMQDKSLEKCLQNGLKLQAEDSGSRSWADEMEREDEERNRVLDTETTTTSPRTTHNRDDRNENNKTPKRDFTNNKETLRNERRQTDDNIRPMRRNQRKFDDRRFDHRKTNSIQNGNNTLERNSPEGKADSLTKQINNDETEENDRLNSDQSSIFEMADNESCPSPPKNTKRKMRKKKRRPKSESSTDEKSPAKNPDRREKNSGSSTSKGGGILHLPTGRPPSAPMMHMDSRNQTMVFTGNLYNPHNPAQPKAVYRPIQGDQRLRTDEYIQDLSYGHDIHPVMASCHGEHVRGLNNYQYQTYPQPHPEAMSWRPGGLPVRSSNGPINPSKSGHLNKTLNDALRFEQEIVKLLNRPFDKVDLVNLSKLRYSVKITYENAILNDIEYCADASIEQALWKAAFYQVIEVLRKQMQEYPSAKNKIKRTMLEIIEEGVLFYETLLEKLQMKYVFDLATFLDSEAVRPKMLVQVKMALISAQKMIISLGDLARYKEQANETTNYKKAKNLYLKAQQLAPKNGRPYNQLAILALYERRKLDAVYYYMRSLSASNPFLSAKEGLDKVFDDAKRKYEQVEKGRLECQNSKQVKERKKNGPEREEVWYLPNGSLANNSENSDDDDDDSYNDLSKLSTVDLNKKFVLSFLHAHGRLFTKIEMGSFIQVVIQLLREFTCLLRMSPLPLNSTRLIQLVAINMFTIERTQGINLDSASRILLQVYALQLSFEMFRLIVDRATTLLRHHLNNCSSKDLYNFPEDLNHLLPSIKVWCDWLICNEKVWNTPRPTQIKEIRNNGDVDSWTLLADFLSLAKKMDMRHIGISKERRKEDWEPVTLPEDTTLAGFVPLLERPPEAAYVPLSTDKELARNASRFSRFEGTAEFLCGLETPILDYDVVNKVYKLHFGPNYSEDGIESGQMNGIQKQYSLSQEDEGSCGKNAEMTRIDTGSGSSEIEKLKSRKEELTRKKADQERHQQEVQAVLSDTNAGRKRFEIHPNYIIADTNCFIDHLDGIRKLVAADHFHLEVPLVVVNELDGLSKGCGSDMLRGDQHNSKVVSGAKEALEYLKGIFGPPCHPFVRAVTAQGSEMKSLQFTSETIGQNRDCNDDIILDCCKAKCKEEGVLKDNVQHFTRNAVLLTDDRALRVKAVNADVPTREIQRFLLLMRIS